MPDIILNVGFLIYQSKVVPREFNIGVLLSYLLAKRKTLIKNQMELLVSLLPVKVD